VTDRELAILLIEKLADAKIDKKIAVFVNRLMLRLQSQPALIANLADVSVFKPGIESNTDDQVKDGQFQEGQEDRDDENNDEKGGETVLLQLSFRRLPQEVVTPLLRLIAAPREAKLYKFVKDGQARTGVEMELRPSDFPGEEYDYAF
jgi:hypothetical protein